MNEGVSAPETAEGAHQSRRRGRARGGPLPSALLPYAFTVYMRFVQTIDISPVRLALEAYITTGLARVNRNCKRLCNFFPYGLTSRVLSSASKTIYQIDELVKIGTIHMSSTL
jgi:hypothetical protein